MLGFKAVWMPCYFCACLPVFNRFLRFTSCATPAYILIAINNRLALCNNTFTLNIFFSCGHTCEHCLLLCHFNVSTSTLNLVLSPNVNLNDVLCQGGYHMQYEHHGKYPSLFLLLATVAAGR